MMNSSIILLFPATGKKKVETLSKSLALNLNKKRNKIEDAEDTYVKTVANRLHL